MIYGDCFLSLYRQYEFKDLGCSLLLCECHSASLRSAVHLYGNNSYVSCRVSCAQCLLCVRSSYQCVVLKCHLALPPPRSFILYRIGVTHELEIRLFLHCSGKLICIRVLLLHLRLVLFPGLSVDGHIGSLNLIAFIGFLCRLLLKFHFRRLNRFYRLGLCSGCLLTCSLYLVRYLSRCLHGDSGRRLQSLDGSLSIGIGYSRSYRFPAEPVAEPVTNLISEVTCTDADAKRCEQSGESVMSCTGENARQSIGAKSCTCTYHEVPEYLRIHSRLLIQAHHLEVCLFVHVYISLEEVLYVLEKSLPETGLRRFICSSLLKPSVICVNSSVRHLVTCLCRASLCTKFMRLVHSDSTGSRSTCRHCNFTCDRSNVLRSSVRIPVRLRVGHSFACPYNRFTCIGQHTFRQLQCLVLAQTHHLEICLFIHVDPIFCLLMQFSAYSAIM